MFCSASVRSWLENFLLFAAAAAEGWIYFAHVAVRKFTKTTTVWVQIIQNSLILSAPITFLWSKFWARTQSGIFHIACEARNVTWLVRPNWYLDLCAERGGIMIHCFWWWGSAAIKQRHEQSQTLKQLLAQPLPCKSPAYTLRWLAGR